jgi:hypothetical protein
MLDRHFDAFDDAKLAEFFPQIVFHLCEAHVLPSGDLDPDGIALIPTSCVLSGTTCHKR